MRIIYFIEIVSLAAALSSCGYYREEKGNDPAGQKLGGAVDFQVMKEKIFAPRCITCHGQFSKYANVKRELSAISSSINSGRMPKSGGPLTAQEKNLLAEWIAAGAPETFQQTPVPEPDELKASWASIYDHIVAPKCLVCHNPAGQAKFLDLSTRQAFFESRNRSFDGKKLLDFERPDQSYLIEVIEDEAEPMPPVWSSIPRLSEDQISVLKEWIRLGLP